MHKRGGIWYFSINGTRQSSGTGDRERAKALKRKLENEAWDRKHGLHIPTWDEACLDWLEKHRHLKSYVQQLIFARWWKKHLTGLKLTALTKDLIHRTIIAHRPVDLTGPSKKNSTANVYVFFVEKIVRANSNLKPSFTRYPEPRGDRWLRPEEWRDLVQHMPTDLQDIATFALSTGLREGNVMRFEWGWLHGSQAFLPATVTKTERDYGIPLNTIAQAVIARRRDMKVRHPRYVFTNAGKVWTCVMLLRALKRAQEGSDIAPLTFHTLRHTFASWLAQKGVSDAVRCRLGCWSTGGAASRYVHFDVEGLRSFSEQIVPNLSQDGQSKPQVIEGKTEVA